MLTTVTAASKPFWSFVSAWIGAPAHSHSLPGPCSDSISSRPVLRPISRIWSTAKTGISARLPWNDLAERRALDQDRLLLADRRRRALDRGLHLAERDGVAADLDAVAGLQRRAPRPARRSRRCRSCCAGRAARSRPCPARISACRREASALGSRRLQLRLRPITHAGLRAQLDRRQRRKEEHGVAGGAHALSRRHMGAGA